MSQYRHLYILLICGFRTGYLACCKLQKRRFILISQNDLTANVFRNVCNNDKIETRVPLVTGENLENKTANRSNEARFDIESRWF